LWRSWQGNTIYRNVYDKSLESVSMALESIGTKSDQVVPLDEGPLKNSKTIILERGPNPTGSISYGGGPGTGKPIIPYAIRWHQVQANFQHGRKRFYLKEPFYRFGPDFLRRALRDKLGGVL